VSENEDDIIGWFDRFRKKEVLEDADQGPVPADNSLKEYSDFIKETLTVYERMDIIYGKLAALGISSELKNTVLDEIRFSFADMNKAKVEKSLADLTALGEKVKLQVQYYTIGYSVLWNHLPSIVKTFETAAGKDKQQDLSLYTGLKQFRQTVLELKYERFNELQGQPSGVNVCPNTGLAKEVLTRFGDEKLASSLRNELTGWGKEGKGRVLKIIDLRLKEKEVYDPELLEYYTQSKKMILDYEASLKRFEQLSAIVKQQVDVFEAVKKTNLMLAIVDLNGLFEAEKKLEHETLLVLQAKQKTLKQMLESVGFMQQQMAKTKNDYYKAKMFWQKHRKAIYLCLDTIALVGMVLTPPVGMLMRAGTTIAKKAGLASNLSRYFSRARQVMHNTASIVSSGKSLKDTATNWWRMITESNALPAKAT
jgi:hypothetical protein